MSQTRTHASGWRSALTTLALSAVVYLASIPLRRVSQKRQAMAENRPVTRTPQAVAEPPHEAPFVHCDRDQSCARAICEVIVVIENVAKRLYFCGHHYRENQIHIFERGYEVNEL